MVYNYKFNCIADEVKNKRIKKEKGRKIRKTSKKQEAPTESPTSEKEKLMSVLELLELQARARAIRSQLALETKVDKAEETKETDEWETKDDSDPEAVIIQSPKKDEIVISSSESDRGEGSRKKQKTGDVGSDSGNPKSWEAKPSSSIIQNSIICGNRKTQKIKIVRDRIVVAPLVNSVDKKSDCVEESNKNTTENVETNSTECNNFSNKEKAREKMSVTEAVVETSEQKDKTIEKRNSCYDNEHSDNEPDIIVINLDDSDDLGCDES